MRHTRYHDNVSETFLTITSNPTDEERLNFLETQIRRLYIHGPMCDTIVMPTEYGKVNWWKRTVVIKKAVCDCWLSQPLGSMGLTGVYE